jgi:hypothetical protein
LQGPAGERGGRLFELEEGLGEAAEERPVAGRPVERVELAELGAEDPVFVSDVPGLAALLELGL